MQRLASKLWKPALAVLVSLAALGLAVLLYQNRRVADDAVQGVWTCSMHPQVRQSGPGRCPICGMELVPVELLDRTNAANVETEAVEYRELFKEIRTVGKIDYDEARVAHIAARIAGRVDRLYADFTGVSVKTDDHLVDIYSPDLFVAQQELIGALAGYERAKQGQPPAQVADALSLLDAGREKLRLWGMLPRQIAEIESSRSIKTHLTIYAPIGGTVIDKLIREGQYVTEGDLLYRIADFESLWLFLDIYEYDLSWVRFGQSVAVTVEAYPGEAFHGAVTFIPPFLDDKTRSVKVRVNLKNPDGKLKPMMYANATIRVRLQSDGTPEPTGLEGKYMCPMHPEVVRDAAGRCPKCEMTLERIPGAPAPTRPAAEKPADRTTDRTEKVAGRVLAVPVSAVLDTGRRKVTFRQSRDSAYEMVDLTVGPRAEAVDRPGQTRGYFPVLAGLEVGDRVVVRGGFLLDSQRQIEGMPSLLFPKGQSGAALHSGHGGESRPAPAPPAEHKH